MTMIANDHDRLTRRARAARQADETPYDVVVVCLWFVLGIALTALLLWLALGGQL
jgi:hypothetical protein